LIHFIQNKDIDRGKWDRLVHATPGALIYNASWYLDVISDTWHALVAGDYEAALPLPTTIKGGITMVYQPFFSREFSLLSPVPLTGGDLGRFLEGLPSSYKSVHLGLGMTGQLNLPLYKTHTYIYQALEPGKPYDDIARGYSSNARRILKKLTASGYDARPVPSALVSETFRLNKAQEITGMDKGHLDRLSSLMAACDKHGNGFALGLFDKDELLATAYFMEFRDRITYLKGASTPAGKKCGAMFGIMDHVIRNAGETKTLDFGGSRIESIAAFFRKLGGKDQYYLYLSRELPFFLNLGKKILKMIRK
jgi:hypothetical protein